MNIIELKNMNAPSKPSKDDVISPTLKYKPTTPNDLYVNDNTLTPGTLKVVTHDSLSILQIKPGESFTIKTKDIADVNYYSNLDVEGLSVTVTTGPDPSTTSAVLGRAVLGSMVLGQA